jgi:hypothetical protein
MRLFIFSTACMEKYPGNNSIKMSMNLFKKLVEKRRLSNKRKQGIYFKNKSDFLV